ncbi:MAG: hypothetical protein KA243_02220 [Candidatus Aminicenantes bacterium]|nr:hypothetical protein [Candidatus Aminicenantes bacterium]
MPIITRQLGGEPKNQKEAPVWKAGKRRTLPGSLVFEMVSNRKLIQHVQLKLDTFQLVCGYELRESVEDKDGTTILIEAYPNCKGRPGSIVSSAEPDYFVLNRGTGLYEESDELFELWADDKIAGCTDDGWGGVKIRPLKARYERYLRMRRNRAAK